jgi:hypothetical protein
MERASRRAVAQINVKVVEKALAEKLVSILVNIECVKSVLLVFLGGCCFE